MTTITGITSQPKQQFAFALEDGSQVAVYIEYRPQQFGWFANFAWGDTWVVNGLRLVSSPNILHKWYKLIPFGLSITTEGNAEPLNQTDFATGRSTVILLNAADVVEVNGLAFSAL
jgi:hypothetical protein